MINDVLEMLADMFQSVLGLFNRVISGLSAWDLVFGAFIVVTIYRLLLVPILGGQLSVGSSDTVNEPRAVTGLENAKKSKKKG